MLSYPCRNVTVQSWNQILKMKMVTRALKIKYYDAFALQVRTQSLGNMK